MKKFHFIPLLLLTGLIAFSGCNRKGCTDSEALNYDEKAKKDDGTCIYDIKPEVIVKDDGTGLSTTTWYSYNEYVLDGLVYVKPGEILTIEPGTVIRGYYGLSGLIIPKGAQIMAEGTADNPIIFTIYDDDLSDPADFDLSLADDPRGLWGGLVILGSATLNSTPGISHLSTIPAADPRGDYGGNNDQDNSGVLKYVSIRHAGESSQGVPMSALTLAGVGSGTRIDYVETILCKDDGIQILGGNVQAKHLVSAFSDEDCFDFDEGYHGKGQFWLSVSAEDSDRGIEHDGGTDPVDGTPFSIPTFYNLTVIGGGESQGDVMVTLRDNAGGYYNNSIFMEQTFGVDVEDWDAIEDSYDRFVAGELEFNDNIFWNIAGNNAADIFYLLADTALSTTDSTNHSNALIASFNANNNQVLNPSITPSYIPNGAMDLSPANNNVLSGAPSPTDSWFSPVTYRGAFDGSTNWLSGWSGLSHYGYLAE